VPEITENPPGSDEERRPGDDARGDQRHYRQGKVSLGDGGGNRH
jgi:hypothetical protein